MNEHRFVRVGHTDRVNDCVDTSDDESPPVSLKLPLLCSCARRFFESVDVSGCTNVLKELERRK